MTNSFAFAKPWQQPSVLPGFGLTVGFSLPYLPLIVLFPLGALVLKSSSLTLAEYAEILGDTRVSHALYISFGTAFIAALINVVFGVLLSVHSIVLLAPANVTSVTTG